MELIKKIVIPDPPSKWVKVAKKKIDPKTGKLKVDTYYLTANLFYADQLHFITRGKIVNYAKDFLMCYCQGLPKLQKMRLKVIYSRPDENFDLDNKCYFWGKIFMDLIKTPSKRQTENAFKKNKHITSLRILPDDTVKYLDQWHNYYVKGKHEIIFEIWGVKATEQKKLFN